MELLIAAVVSGIVEIVKRVTKTDTTGTLMILVAVSFCAAGLMFALKSYGLWEAFSHIAVMAAGVFALFVQHLPKSTE